MIDREHPSPASSRRTRASAQPDRGTPRRSNAGAPGHGGDRDRSPRGNRSQRPRYVRQRTPHHNQGLVDDLANESIPLDSYAHDSNFAVRGANPLSGLAYHRSRSKMTRIRRSTRYGRYLEIPKGRRSIFFSRERVQRRHSLFGLLVAISLLAVAALIVWKLIQALPR
jgi:hypothetical protein